MRDDGKDPKCKDPDESSQAKIVTVINIIRALPLILSANCL
jgi:hypothetical protein